MKKTNALLFVSVLLAACSESDTITVSPYLASDEVKSYSDLPKCTEYLNDLTYYVQKDNTKYKCSNKKWENEILVDTSIKGTASSSSAVKSSSGTSSSRKSSSSSTPSSSSAAQSSSSVYYTVAVFGKCTKDREGEIKMQNDSTRINYKSDFICEPPYWRRMIAYDYTFEELHKSTANYGTLIDERDGEEYKTVVIGAYEWMAENLRYKIPNDTMFNGGQNCYRKNPKYCKIGGYYYSYDDKPKACPDGWGLPGRGAVESLVNNTTDQSIKSQFAWYKNDSARVLNNTNESGFTLLSTETVIMASEIYATQEYIGYYALPNTYMYAGASYAKKGKYEKNYHIRCVRFAQTSSSSAEAKSSSSSAQQHSSSAAKVVSSSSSIPQILSSSQTTSLSSEVKQESSSSSAEAKSSSSSVQQSSSSSAKVDSSSSRAPQISSSSQTTSSSSEVKQESSSSSAAEETPSSSTAQS
ncbi:MAG: hypothetical protein IIT53_12105 [Fibrobacter sp.]|nr:hypothetical protein [Fibrobacter sp.]